MHIPDGLIPTEPTPTEPTEPTCRPITSNGGWTIGYRGDQAGSWYGNMNHPPVTERSFLPSVPQASFMTAARSGCLPNGPMGYWFGLTRMVSSTNPRRFYNDKRRAKKETVLLVLHGLAS